jgi:hypothetical protein
MRQLLRVRTNPSHTRDHLGRPCCAVPCDPVEHVTNGLQRYVGARPKVEETGGVMVNVKGRVGVIAYPTSDVTWDFEDGIIELPSTKYYLDQLRSGALLPADETTARSAGIKYELAVKGAA